LAGVAGRYSAEELRQRIIDARAFQSDTIMPPYYSTKGLLRVGSRWLGQTIYQAQDVEDVVAFLMTLKD
jgi:sulfur-oxidizing protein SoxX